MIATQTFASGRRLVRVLLENEGALRRWYSEEVSSAAHRTLALTPAAVLADEASKHWPPRGVTGLSDGCGGRLAVLDLWGELVPVYCEVKGEPQTAGYVAGALGWYCDGLRVSWTLVHFGNAQ